MSKFKSIIFITCHIFFLAQFCLGDDGFEEKVNNLEESDQQKEKRIADLETKNIELITELQNLGIQFEQAQKNNLNESTLAQRIANLEATNIELVAQLQKLVKDKDVTSEDKNQPKPEYLPIRNRLLCKEGSDGDDSYLKSIIKLRKKCAFYGTF